MSPTTCDGEIIKVEDGEMRSGLQPCVFKKRSAQATREPIPRAPSIADHFIPEGPYDTSFAVMRHMIFKINRKSATPITHIIFPTCTSAEVVTLVSNLCPEPSNGKDYERWWEKPDDVKLKHPPYAKLHAKMEEARKMYATSLRDHGYEDVDITYSGNQANYGITKDDEEVIRRTGGKVYHRYPLDFQKRTITNVVLVSSVVLEKLFPAERMVRGISISSNLPEVVVERAAAQEPGDSLSARSDATLEVRNLSNAALKAQERHQKFISRSITDICYGLISGENEHAVLALEKAPWNQQESDELRGYLQSVWSPNNVPFSNYEYWQHESFWSVDLAIRKKMLDEWKTEWAAWESINPSALPNESAAVYGYPLAAEMCGTYPANTSAKWYNDNVMKAELKEKTAAEERRQLLTRAAKRKQYHSTRNVTKTKSTQAQQLLRSEAPAENITDQEVVAVLEVESPDTHATKLRENTNAKLGDTSEVVEDKTVSPNHSSPPIPIKSPSPSYKSRSHITGAQYPANGPMNNREITFTDRVNALWLEKQAAPSSYTPAEDLTEPFPQYEDPIAKEIEEFGQSRAEQIQQLKQEARSRKATKTSIGDILTATGIYRDDGGCGELRQGEDAVESSDDLNAKKGKRKVVRFDDDQPQIVHDGYAPEDEYYIACGTPID